MSSDNGTNNKNNNSPEPLTTDENVRLRQRLESLRSKGALDPERIRQRMIEQNTDITALAARQIFVEINNRMAELEKPPIDKEMMVRIANEILPVTHALQAIETAKRVTDTDVKSRLEHTLQDKKSALVTKLREELPELREEDHLTLANLTVDMLTQEIKNSRAASAIR